jgi:hypothetical protein
MINIDPVISAMKPFVGSVGKQVIKNAQHNEAVIQV